MTERIYLDNAATSQPKPETVYQCCLEALRSCGNAGRGGHDASLAADRLIFNAREALADFFGISDSSRIVFTLNATTAINTALFGLLKPGDRVVTSSMEHNAVMRPLRHLADLGVEVVKVAADARGLLDPKVLRAACQAAPTRMLVLNHCSNVNGQLQSISGLGDFCRQQGILFMLDAAQSAGTFPLLVEAEKIDLLAIPGHKNLLGPAGTGMLYVRPGLQLAPLTFGGTGANSQSDLPPEMMPERLESGTQNLSGIAGLFAAVTFLQAQGRSRLRSRVEEHLRRIIDGLSALDGVHVFAADDLSRQGDAISFTIDNVDPAEIGYRLDHEFGICTRVGLHCAPEAHKTLGTFPQGTVRVSPGIFTQKSDIEKFLSAVNTINSRS